MWSVWLWEMVRSVKRPFLSATQKIGFLSITFPPCKRYIFFFPRMLFLLFSSVSIILPLEWKSITNWSTSRFGIPQGKRNIQGYRLRNFFWFSFPLNFSYLASRIELPWNGRIFVVLFCHYSLFFWQREIKVVSRDQPSLSWCQNDARWHQNRSSRGPGNSREFEGRKVTHARNGPCSCTANWRGGVFGVQRSHPRRSSSSVWGSHPSCHRTRRLEGRWTCEEEEKLCNSLSFRSGLSLFILWSKYSLLFVERPESMKRCTFWNI